MVENRELLETARREMIEFFDLGSEEEVLVLTDTFDESEQRFRIADALCEAASKIATSKMLQFPPLYQSGINPPANVIEAMHKADVILICTGRSLTHSAATVGAIEKGKRIGTHTNKVESYVRAVKDLEGVKKRGDRFCAILNARSNRTLHLTTAKGTDLTVPTGSRRFLNWAGDMRTREGKVENIPGGEIMIAPPEGTGDGILYVDLYVSTWASGKPPYDMVIEAGRLVKCPQDPELVAKYNAKPGRNVLAEVAFGTNHAASKDAECSMEIEKTLGTAHVALGSNVDFGGANQTDVHMDFMFDEVTLEMDGEVLIRDGEQLF